MEVGNNKSNYRKLREINEKLSSIIFCYLLMKNQLIIFTRYPQPGTTKTRLIPALGVEGAATLQRQMTEHTLIQAQRLQQLDAVSVKIVFAGGNQALMEGWLGKDYSYQPQTTGDLGNRLVSAFAEAFKAGSERVIIIGIDCPDITPALLQTGFKALATQNLVLGPANDGGYYLIGLNRLFPELFQGIRWGTSTVFSQTLSIAQHLSLSTHLLPTLSDVDRPEDLGIWEEYRLKLERIKE